MTPKKRSVREYVSALSENDERGNAVAAFVLIVPLVLLVLFSLVVLIYALHIRLLAAEAVYEGVRAGALSGGDTVIAESRTRDVLEVAFDGEYCANPNIATKLLPDKSMEVSLYCPLQKTPWLGMYIPDMTVSANAYIE